MCLLWGGAAPLVYAIIRDLRSLRRGPRETMAAAGSGVVSLVACGIIIFAMSFGPMRSGLPCGRRAWCSRP